MILLVLLVFIPSLSAIDNCSLLSQGGNTCVSCKEGFTLTSSQNCSPSCLDLFYLNSNDECSSQCSLSQIGNSETKACEEINPCPNSFNLGKSFHTEKVSSILKREDRKELISICKNDNFILVWEQETSNLLAKLEGHTSPPLKMFFQENSISHSILLLSFSINEIIVWNYDKTSITSINQIPFGQVTSNSEVDQLNNYITTFGIQGEFYLINYFSLSILKFIGHSNIVDVVLFLGQNYLVSSAKDKSILLWKIKSLNQPQRLIQMAVSRMQIQTLIISNVQYSLFFALGGEQINQYTTILISCLDSRKDSNDIIQQFQDYLLAFHDHIDSILDFIVDTDNNQFISYSSTQILIYSSVIENGVFKKFQMKEKIDLASILTTAYSIISTCDLVDIDKFVIGTNKNQVFLFQYSASSLITLTPYENLNYLTIQRNSQIQSEYHFDYSQQSNNLYIFSDQIISVNYSTLEVNYIITNFITPPMIQHTDYVISITFSQIDQLIASISRDTNIIILDFITGELLNVIQNPKNKNIPLSATQILPVQIVIVSSSAVCVSYNDYSIICYHPLSSNIIFKKEQSPVIFSWLQKDSQNNWLLAIGENIMILFDLNAQSIKSQYTSELRIDGINFEPKLGFLVFTSSKYQFFKVNYPKLTISIQKDYSYLNTNKSQLKGFDFEQTFYYLGVSYYNDGLMIVLKNNLSLVSFKTSSHIPENCQIFYLQIVSCVAVNGVIYGWGIYFPFLLEKPLYNFEIISVGYSLKYQKAFMIMNQGPDISGIYIGSSSIFLAEYSLQIPQSISKILPEDKLMRVLTPMNNGDISDFHYTAVISSFLIWNDLPQGQSISNIFVYEESYKLIILSKIITIYDYLNSRIERIGRFHNNIITDIAIDKIRNLIISFDQGKEGSFFVWDFKNDIVTKLSGHNDQIIGIIFFSLSSGKLISYSNDGKIIIWDYLKGEILKKLNLNYGFKILQVFIAQAIFPAGIQKEMIISLDYNQIVSIYDYEQDEITSQITLINSNCRIILDTINQRIFSFYQNSIQVFSYLTGLKIAELLGFDGNIGSDIQFQEDSIIAHGQFVISSFNRESLNMQFTSKSTQPIYQIAIIGTQVGMISNAISTIIKVWDYKTGNMLEDINYTFDAIPLYQIYADYSAKLFVVSNTASQIFTFDPFADSSIKLDSFLINLNFTSSIILGIVWDYQSNLIFSFNSNQIVQWSYFAHLGKKGQQRNFPSNSQIHCSYNSQDGNKIFIYINFNLSLVNKYLIYYADMEKNLWAMSNNQVTHSQILSTLPQECIILGGVLIIREQNKINSYSQQPIKLISSINLSTLKIVYNTEETNVFFAITIDLKIFKIGVIQQSCVLEQMVEYYSSSVAKSRWFLSVVNFEYNHLIVSSILGQMVIFNYSSDTLISDTNDSKASLTQIVLDNQNSRLYISSFDGTVVAYIYQSDSLILKQKITFQESVEQLIIDRDYSRLIYWVNLQTKIVILDQFELSTIKMKMLSPSDSYLKIKISFQYNKYAIFNMFQVNIYEREDIAFLSSIRNPSDLKDIRDAIFLDSKNILIISQTLLRIYTFSSSSLSLVSSLSMTGTQLLFFNYEQTNHLLSLKGVNYETAFNYTSYLLETGSSSTTFSPLSRVTCYQNIQDPTNFFQLKLRIQESESPFLQFNSISQIKYNLIFTPMDQKFINITFPQISSLVGYETQVLFTSNQQTSVSRVLSTNQNKKIQFQDQIKDTHLFSFNRKLLTQENYLTSLILINLQMAEKEYNQNSLILNNFILLVNEQVYEPIVTKFNSHTKNIYLKNGIIHGNNLKSTAILGGLQFNHITSFIIEDFNIMNIQFNSSQASDYQNSLIQINKASRVMIKNLIISNITITNQSIFKISNVDSVIIEEITISNFSVIITEELIASIFSIMSCNNVSFKSISISNIQSQYPFNLLSLEGNIQTTISMIRGNDLLNCRLVYYSQQYDENNFEYKVLNDKVILDSIEIKNIISSQSQIQIKSNNSVLDQITATNVICEQCDGAIIQAFSKSFSLSNSEFQYNSALKGGCISLQECSTNCNITNSQIKNNYAIYGGGIYLMNSELFLKSTSIESNQAFIGGGIKYLGKIPLQILQHDLENYSNFIQNNIATVFGNNYGSFLREIVFINNGEYSTISIFNSSTSNPQTQTYNISAFMSGDNFKFSVIFKDEEGRSLSIDTNLFNSYPDIIKKELNNYKIQCYSDNELIQLNSETLISLNKYDSSTKSFSFDKLIISSQPNTDNHFYLKANNIELPTPFGQTFYSPSFSIFFNLQLRKCKIGEIQIASPSSQQTSCKKCQEGMYSIKIPDDQNGNDNCQLCPDEALSCKGSEIILKNGYWRANNQTDLIAKCFNAPENCQSQSPDSINYCKKGLIGPLCEICDIEGKVWKKRYSQAQDYQCQTCDNMFEQYILQIIFFIFIIGYICIGVNQAYLVSYKKIKGYYLRMLGLLSIGTSVSQNQSSVYMKFLMHYLYISQIAKEIQLKFLYHLDLTQQQIALPIQIQKNFSDCYLLSIFPFKPVFSRQIISQIFPVSLLISTYLVYTLLVLFKKIQFSKNHIIIGLTFIFIFIQPDLLSGIISVSTCRTIANQQYIKSDISEICFTSSHIQFVMLFCLPLFIFWAVLLPFLLFINMHKHRKHLNFIFVRECFGFMYSELKFSVFYWEIVKINLKLIATLIDNYFQDQIVIKTSSISIFIFFYFLATLKLKPFESLEFNQLDRTSHTLLLVIFQISTLSARNDFKFIQMLTGIIFYFIHYSFITYLVSKIFSSKLYDLSHYFLMKFPNLNQDFPMLIKLLPIIKNRISSFKHWRIVWRQVYQKSNKSMILKSNLDKTENFLYSFSKKSNPINEKQNIKKQQDSVQDQVKLPLNYNILTSQTLPPLKQIIYQDSLLIYDNQFSMQRVGEDQINKYDHRQSFPDELKQKSQTISIPQNSKVLTISIIKEFQEKLELNIEQNSK